MKYLKICVVVLSTLLLIACSNKQSDAKKFKEENHLRPIDRISRTIDTLDMVSTIISTLNS